MRYTPNGSAVTSFSLAVNRRYTPPNGEPQEETEWFDVTAWNRLAGDLQQLCYERHEGLCRRQAQKPFVG